MHIEGISHITFIVRDLERMAHFLCFGLGAREVYFYDFDNHFFELHTGTLEQRLERYARGA